MNCIINCTVCKRKVFTQVRILKWISFMAIANDILLNSSSDVISWLCNPEFYLEAVVRRCSIKKLFIKISQNSQENTCTRVFFFFKGEFCEVFKNTYFYRTSLVAASVCSYLVQCFTHTFTKS